MDETTDRRITRRDMLAQMAAAVFTLTGARAFAQGTETPAAGRAPWDDRFELAVNLQVAETGGFRTHRPYVAVYIEDPSGNQIRTLSLWVQNYGRGQGYIQELRRWIRGPLADQLVSTVSSATRNPGSYSVLWNGRDDAGKPVQQGQYFVVIEAAREHGTYQVIRQDFDFGRKAFRADLQANVEIGAASVDYHVKKK